MPKPTTRITRSWVSAQIHLLHRSQGHRRPVRHHRAAVSCSWVLLMMMMRWSIALSRPARPACRAAAGKDCSARTWRARASSSAGSLQFLRRHARDDHGVLRRSCRWPSALSAISSFRCKSARRTWRFPAQHGQLPVSICGRPDHVDQLLHSRRRGAIGLDLLSAAGDAQFRRHQRPDVLAHRHGVPDHLLAAGLGQLSRHDHPTARAGHDLDAPAVFRLGAVRHRLPAAAGLSSAGSRRRHAVDGQGGAHELLPAHRPGRQPARRMSAAAAARCSGSTCSGSSAIRKFMC